jgi:small subunit ribosomal protein S24e
MFGKLNKTVLYQVNTAHEENAMEIKIISEKTNPLLQRREICFHVKHDQTGSTPPRLEIRKAVAAALKANADLVFVQKFETKTGSHIAVGVVNVYDSVEQAKLIEPEYILKRNVPPEKSKEEGKE